ncbi:alkaline phosphatase D family protein [Novipirellula artificiosorum]|uniref:PhoD-like phosphatase n=1 Tax=Novipirellula artificiosorum TaxID=2528016 RepID=A0A5C6D6V4_9BACT|nr:alkaline phosphatase D family protein [Novipirellula artificiosorum]TWU32550.1 PhoD-like phosphatase [Novipirellula artificiosorum]
MKKGMVAAILLLAGIFSLNPSGVLGEENSLHQQLKTGDLEASLRILNLWGEQPAVKQNLLKFAYAYLSASKDRTFAGLAEQPEFQTLCRQAEMTHLGGPLLGSVTETGSNVWIRTLKPAKVEVQVSVDGENRSYGPVNSTVESDLTAVVTVTDLSSGTRYPYRVLVDGKPVSLPAPTALVTAPAATTSGKVRIAFGSCFHRWGIGNLKQADLIRSRKPSAILLLGDIAVQDRWNHLGLHRMDYLMRDLTPAWQNLAATVPVYATWDDHDYFSNDKAGVPKGYTEQDKAGVCDVFKQAWNNPSYGFNDERRGVFLRARVGPCDVVMVDNRYFRKNEKGSFLGDEQMKWLEEQLLDCKGPFIILSCGSMWSDYVSKGKDSWGVWDPEGRERIFRLIEKNRIGGVLLISGDRHGARGFRIPRPSGFSFYEFEAGSLGGRSGPSVTSEKWDTQFYGISGQYAFGEFSIDAELPDPEVTFRLIKENGTEIHKLILKHSQLTPPGL